MFLSSKMPADVSHEESARVGGTWQMDTDERKCKVRILGNHEPNS